MFSIVLLFGSSETGLCGHDSRCILLYALEAISVLRYHICIHLLLRGDFVEPVTQVSDVPKGTPDQPRTLWGTVNWPAQTWHHEAFVGWENRELFSKLHIWKLLVTRNDLFPTRKTDSWAWNFAQGPQQESQRFEKIGVQHSACAIHTLSERERERERLARLSIYMSMIVNVNIVH